MKPETIVKKVKEIDVSLAFGDGYKDSYLPKLRRRLKSYKKQLQLAYLKGDATLTDLALCQNILICVEETMEEGQKWHSQN